MIVETLLAASVHVLGEYAPAAALNAAGGKLKRSLTNRLARPDEVLRNHDLQRLAGAAVELVIRSVAQLDTFHTGDLERLAKAVAADWYTLLGYPSPQGGRSVPALAERQLPKLIAGLPEDPWADGGRAEQGPERGEWEELLARADRGKAWQRLPEHVREKVLVALVQLTPFAVRELLKHDASADGGGLAFAGFHLIFMDEVRSDLGQISDALLEYPAALGELQILWTRLEQRLAEEAKLAQELGIALEDLRATTREIQGLHGKVDQVLAGLALMQEHLFARADEKREASSGIRAAARPADTVGITDLFELVPESTSVADLGLVLIRACNAEARKVYRARVHGESSAARLHLWDGFWRADDFQAMRHYVRIADREGEYVDYRIRRLLAERARQGQPCQLWMVGEAGTGKTTALQHTYFRLVGAVDALPAESDDASAAPVPWLLQPHLLDPASVDRLRQAARAGTAFEALLRTWLENRRIRIPAEHEATIVSSVLHHLRHGRIVPMIDGFDELSRMALQHALIEGVASVSEHFVIASRPEALGAEVVSGEKITLNPAWDFEATRSYLLDRLPASYAAAITPFMNYIYGNESVEWLRNPRYLNIFVQILDDLSARSEAAALALIALLGLGEYRLLEEFQGAVLHKLRRQATTRFPELLDGDFTGEITRRLEQIAGAQLRTGGLAVDAGHDAHWNLIAGAGDILLASGAPEHPLLKFLNYNFIDFFLAGPIAREVASRNPLTHCHKWSDHQVRFVSAYLRRGRTADGAARKELVRSIWEALEQFRGRIASQDGLRSLDSRFGAVNLVHLAIQVESDLLDDGEADGRAARHRLEIARNFDRLDLAEIDLSDLSFCDCEFNGTNLASAHLDRSSFAHCNFTGADLRRASAELATFDSCDFVLVPAADGRATHHQGTTRVEGMLIRQAKFEYCDGANPETMESAGADRRGSRYVGLFGEIFRSNQRALLGRGVEDGERRYYLPRILAALEASQRPGPIYLIDLMAGGSNDRLARLMAEDRFRNVHVLALDRDTRQLTPMKDRLGARFAAVKKVIQGRANLLTDLRENFDERPVQADVIIGKKALHELPRDAQIELLAECSELLRPDGRLILFADAPASMAEAGYDRLHGALSVLRGDEPPALVRRRLIDELALDGSPVDCALFANLWVAMKDWANGNREELRDRYFSSFDEIAAWARDAGFDVSRIAGPENVHYVLQARIFNEIGINELGTYLENTGGSIHRKDHGLITQHFAGNERYRVFVDFADTHLWDFEGDRPRPGLGEALGATRDAIPYHRVHPDLASIRRLPERGVAFRFPVHIIELRKRAEA